MRIDLSTWLLFAGTVLLWGASVLLAGDRSTRRQLTWRVIPLSIFGFVWVGFGVQFIFRFLALAYDPELFRATHYPPWLLPPEVLFRTWLALGIFWGVFCAGYASVVLLMPKTPRIAFIQLGQLVSLRKIRVLDVMCLIALVAILISNMKMVPRALLTPVGLVGLLFIIPLTIAWCLYFEGHPIGIRRFVYMIPGIINYLLSPYRDHLVMLAIAVMLPAIQIRRKISLYKLLIGIIAFLLISSTINDIYRPIRWGEKSRQAQGRVEDQWEAWREDPTTSPWVRIINRFHAFDSTAITVNAVPSFFPFSNRNVFAQALVRAILPRAVFDTKPDKDRSREFSANIWSLTERGLTKRTPSTIAPSMVGDLYSANGLPMVFFGGLIFGLLVAFLTKWIPTPDQASTTIIIVYFGLRLAWALECDFAFAVGTIIQQFVVFVSVFFLLTKIGRPKVISNRNRVIGQATK